MPKPPPSVSSIFLSSDGAIQLVSPLAAKLMGEFFEWHLGDSLPFPLAAWVGTAMQAHTTAKTGKIGARPLDRVVDQGARRLLLRLRSDEEDSWNLEMWEASALDTSAGGVWDRLTPRKREVLNWIVEGKTNHEISIILGVGVKAVEKHVSELCRAIGVSNRHGLICEYFRWGHMPDHGQTSTSTGSLKRRRR